MRTCKYRNCDNKFTGAPGRLYCDGLCKSREAEYRQGKKKTTKTVQCKYIHCGKDIDIIGKESRKYCNNSCRDKAQYLRNHKATKKTISNHTD